MGNQKQTKAAEEMAAERLEAERLREKAGFEERMKAAEEAHVMEEMAKAPVDSAVSPTTTSKSSGSWSIFGLKKTSPEPAAPVAASSTPSPSEATITPEKPTVPVASVSTDKLVSSRNGWAWFGSKG